MDQYAGSPGHSTYCYAEVAASFINFLHYRSPFSGLCDAGKDNRGRCTDSLSGHHPIWTIDARTSIIPPIFTLNALSATTLPIYPGLGQVPNIAGLHTRWLGLCSCYAVFFDEPSLSVHEFVPLILRYGDS